MKYIRTKDGIKKVFRKLKNGFYLVKASKYKYYHYYPDCKQADTIEELCDEFVVGFNNKMIISALPFERSLNYGGNELYGAIWTEWGLKYVAKMNDKGELELL